MDQRKRGRIMGIVGALVVHTALLVLLILVGFTLPDHHAESGVEVMMGNVESAYGGFEPSSLVDVEVLDEPEIAAEAEPVPATEQEMLTQDAEETVAITPKSEPKKETPKKPEKTEAEQERKAAAEAAAKRVAGAFGKGAQMGDKGTGTGEGVEGSPTGNSTSGATTGTGGYGTFDLGGRSIGAGGLPRPVYNVQEEGKVVVTITVNPAGAVVSTSINRLTNTVNPTLRKAAEDAAKKARFNAVDGVNNQTGTITYYFNLR